MPVPSSMPCPLLHFTLDPRKQRFVARKIAKAILAQTHPITSECDFSTSLHIGASSGIVHHDPRLHQQKLKKGVNEARLSSTAAEYFLFFSCSAIAAYADFKSLFAHTMSPYGVREHALLILVHTPLCVYIVQMTLYNF